CRFRGPDDDGAAVEGGCRLANGNVELFQKHGSIGLELRLRLRIPRYPRSVDDPEIKEPLYWLLPIRLLNIETYGDGGDEVGFLATFDDHIAAVIHQEKVMVIAGQDKIENVAPE